MENSVIYTWEDGSTPGRLHICWDKKDNSEFLFTGDAKGLFPGGMFYACGSYDNKICDILSTVKKVRPNLAYFDHHESVECYWVCHGEIQSLRMRPATQHMLESFDRISRDSRQITINDGLNDLRDRVAALEQAVGMIRR